MNKLISLLITLLFIALTAVAGWYLHENMLTVENRDIQENLPLTDNNSSNRSDRSTLDRSDNRQTTKNINDAIDFPEAGIYVTRQQLQNRLAKFFNTTKQSDSKMLHEEAQALDTLVEQEELAKRITAAEGAMLRIALIRASISDRSKQLQKIEALRTAYSDEYEQAMAAFVNRNDPAFAAYKNNERAIVNEVQKMTRFPAGLTRDQYLRQRLQQAREIAYRDNNTR